MPDIHIKVTQDQAQAIADALDFYTRICIGQLEEVENLVRSEVVPLASDAGVKRKTATIDECDEIRNLMNAAKKILGYPSSGSNGIGHPHVCKTGHMAYEIKKVIEKTLAELRNPNPTFRGVNYDGLGPRYTTDTAPQSWSE